MGQKIRHLVHRSGSRLPWKVQQYDSYKFYSSYFFKYILLNELFEFIAKKNLIKIIFNEYFQGSTYFYADVAFDELSKRVKTYELQSIYCSQLWLLKLSQWQILNCKILKTSSRSKKRKPILKFIRLKMLYSTWHKIKFF